MIKFGRTGINLMKTKLKNFIKIKQIPMKEKSWKSDRNCGKVRERLAEQESQTESRKN